VTAAAAAAAAVYMTLLKMRKERPVGLSFESEICF
jgi:hypothetical protein